MCRDNEVEEKPIWRMRGYREKHRADSQGVSGQPVRGALPPYDPRREGYSHDYEKGVLYVYVILKE